MIPQAKSLTEYLRTSIWPIPLVITLGALVLSQIVLHVDKIPAVHQFTMKYLSDSRSSFDTVLSTIAASVISVGGIVISVSMVAMTLASGQFGPRVLREYLGNRSAKITLGFFIGTFIYCLVALLSYRSHNDPGLSLMVGVSLALISVLLFVQFIHHTTQSIQADRIIYAVAGQLRGDLREFRQQADDEGRRLGTSSWRHGVLGKRAVLVPASGSGYIESIDYSGLVDLATNSDGFIKLPGRAGKFVLEGEPLCWWYSDSSELDRHALREIVKISRMRTPVQDPEFAITQLLQIAARALSPGINDPGTAVTCIDWLTAALAEVIDSDLPRYSFCDDSGTVRVIGHALDFEGLLRACYVPVHQFARNNLPVTIRLLEALEQLAKLTRRQPRLQLIHQLASNVMETAMADTEIGRDRGAIAIRIRRLESRLGSIRARETRSG